MDEEFAYVVLLFAFIVAIVAVVMHFNRPNRERLFMSAEDSGFERLKSKKAYEKLAKYMVKFAKRKRKQYLRENMLGVAELYRHSPEKAAVHFQNALKGAAGNDIDTINNNLAIAYLQGGWFRSASGILEKERQRGFVETAPYVLNLLLHGQEEEAREFYKNYPLWREEDLDMQIILSVSPSKPETMEPVKWLVEQRHLWLYQSVLKELIARWELEMFYRRTDRYEALANQAKDLLSSLEKQPEMFNDMNVRYMRSLVTFIIPHIGSYDSCSRLWGLIDNLDEFSRNLPLNDELREECALLWRRIYYVFSQTCSVESYDRDLEQEFIKAQLPVDSEPLVKGNLRCNLHVSKSLHQNVRSFQVEQNGFSYCYVHIIPEVEADEIARAAAPVIEVMDEEPSTAEVLEPLLYQLITDRESISDDAVIDVLNRIPKAFHDKLKTLMRQEKIQA